MSLNDWASPYSKADLNRKKMTALPEDAPLADFRKVPSYKPVEAFPDRAPREQPRLDPREQPRLLEPVQPLPDGRLADRINYMIQLLEEQRDEKTGYVTEEIILYVFFGIFIIFVLDSFVKNGKYSR